MPKTMKLSEAAAQAMRGAVLMATRPGERITTKEMAGELKTSDSTLSKVLQRLSAEGIAKAKRGPRGGYMLAKRPGEVTLLDVFEAIEGPLSTEDCLFGLPVCDGRCMLGTLIDQVNETIRRELGRKKLSDLTDICGSIEPANGTGSSA